MDHLLASFRAEVELERIVQFLKNNLSNEEPAVIGISGGLDSDVVARLTFNAIGKSRMKLFLVRQRDMEERHITNARELAGDLDIRLAEIFLEQIPEMVVTSMAEADPESGFLPGGLLDPNRMKCSLRNTIFSAYQDRGYVVVGTSNRTEVETGFFLPLGDGIWHIGPIVHLYKTQVRQLAPLLGVRQPVLDQPASAGFWAGEEDLEDLAFWLYNGGPIGRERDFNDEEVEEVRKIRGVLTTEAVDRALLTITLGKDDYAASESSGLPTVVVLYLRKLVAVAKTQKLRPIGVRLPLSEA
jgi:NAD+ synthase